MPYLQFDLDAKKKVPLVARAVGLPDANVGWGLLDLWEWCWGEHQGRREVFVTPLLLVGFFGSGGKDVGPALVAFGFLEAVENGRYRVKGLDRYVRIEGAIAERNVKGGKSRASSAQRDSRGRLVSQAGQAGSSLGPAIQPEAGQAGDVAGGKSPAYPASLADSREPIAERKVEAPRPASLEETKRIELPAEPFKERLDATWLELRGYALDWTWADQQALRGLLKHGEDETLKRWRNALGYQAFPKCNGVSDLLKHWNTYGRAETAAKAEPPPRRMMGGRPLTPSELKAQKAGAP